MKKIKKVPLKTETYFDLFPLLEGLEKERPGIRKRVWSWLCKEFSAETIEASPCMKNLQRMVDTGVTHCNVSVTKKLQQRLVHTLKVYLYKE